VRSPAPGQPAQEWAEVLRGRGRRLTTQRVRVLEAVADLVHATPEAVAGLADVDLSTVYRTLDLLEGLGLVTHAHLGSGSPSYHLASEQPHLHLVCRGCGHVQEVLPDVVAPLVDRLDAERGFAVDVAHMAVTGWCSGCRSALPDELDESLPPDRSSARAGTATGAAEDPPGTSP